MSINRYWIPVIVIGTLLGSVFGSQILGQWSISGRTSVDLDQLAPEDIKGWMTLQQVADGLNLSIEAVYRVGGIPADTAPGTVLKDLEAIVEVSTLRDTLAAYLSGEQPEDPAVEPTTELETVTEAAPVLAPTAVPAEATAAPLHNGDGTGPTPLPPGEILPASEIKGRMTLQEVSDQCAIDLADLLAALNLPADTDPNTELKTLIQGGVLDEVTQVQEAVAVLQR